MVIRKDFLGHQSIISKISKEENNLNFYIRRAAISSSLWQYKEELREKNPESDRPRDAT